jgi:hypothetical protein
MNGRFILDNLITAWEGLEWAEGIGPGQLTLFLILILTKPMIEFSVSSSLICWIGWGLMRYITY